MHLLFVGLIKNAADSALLSLSNVRLYICLKASLLCRDVLCSSNADKWVKRCSYLLRTSSLLFGRRRLHKHRAISAVHCSRLQWHISLIGYTLRHLVILNTLSRKLIANGTAVYFQKYYLRRVYPTSFT